MNATNDRHRNRPAETAIARGLAQAATLREFVADAAGAHGGAGMAVFGDLAAIDDMVSDLERVRTWLAQDPSRALSDGRARSIAATLARLDLWSGAVAAGTVRAGGLQRLGEK